MIDLIGVGPCPVASLLWQPRPGAWVSTVVCKVTFTLSPGVATLAPVQERIVEEEGVDPPRGLRLPCDLVPVKPAVDVVLVGSAFAAQRRPVTSLVARVSVGELSKAVEVVQDRHVGVDGAVQPGAAFARMPIDYARAAGGSGTANPVGRARDARGDDGRVALPNVQRVGAPPLAFEPWGLGPLAASWPERAARSGARRGGYAPADLAQSALPAGMDLAFFNAAPADQQLRAIRDNARVALENLHEEHASLETALPGLSPSAVVEGRRGGSQPLALRADTLWIDTDRGLCTLTFRASLPLESREESPRIVVTVEAPVASRRSAPPSVARPKPDHLDVTADVPIDFRRIVTPFADAAPQQAPSIRAFAASPAPPAPPEPAWSPQVVAPSRVGEPGAGVLLASNAAAGLGYAAAPVIAIVDKPSSPPPPAPTPARIADAIAHDELLELLWYDPAALPRVRGVAEHRAMLDALDETEPDPDFDDPASAPDPQTLEDRRDVIEVLSAAGAAPMDRVTEALRGGRADRKFAPRLAVYAGELEVALDDGQELELAVAMATSLAGDDTSARAAVAVAKEYLAATQAARPLAMSRTLTVRLDEAIAAAKRGQLADLRLQREAALLEAGAHLRRTVFGGKYVKATLHDRARPGKAAAPSVPAYVADAAAAALPLARRLVVRLIAEVRPSPDPRDAHPAALRIVALARLAKA